MVAGGAMWFAVAIIASLFISEPCLHAAKPRGVKPQPRNLFIDTTHTHTHTCARWSAHSKHMYTFKHISQNSVLCRRQGLVKNTTMAHSWVYVYFITYLKHLQVQLSPPFPLLHFSLKYQSNSSQQTLLFVRFLFRVNAVFNN